MISRRLLEKIACAAAVLVLCLAAWFWAGQIQAVIETLELAYGE